MSNSHLIQSKTKYRPSLTVGEIQHIINLAKKEVPLSDLSIQLISTLAPFLTKIQYQTISEAYTTKPKLSIEDKLGMADIGNVLASTDSLLTSTPTNKEQYWLWCYEETQSKGIENCPLDVIQGANEYRYLNNLMTPEEMIEYEKNCFMKDIEN